MSCNKADAVRSARLKGKKMAIENKNHNKKIVPSQHAKLVKVCADSPRNTTRLLTGDYRQK